MLNVEHKLMQQVAPNQTYEALPHPHKLGTVNTHYHFLISFRAFLCLIFRVILEASGIVFI
jgi:hypothetical protein